MVMVEGCGRSGPAQLEPLLRKLGELRQRQEEASSDSETSRAERQRCDSARVLGRAGWRPGRP